jgi:hypothetical protein
LSELDKKISAIVLGVRKCGSDKAMTQPS